MTPLRIEHPLAKPLPSVANLREHWATKARRVTEQRDRVAYLLASRGRPFRAAWLALCRDRRAVAPDAYPRLRVTLTRVAPRRLDDDNLAHAFKAIRDEVAAFFGVDDGRACWEWRCEQAKGAPGFRIEVQLVEVAP